MDVAWKDLAEEHRRPILEGDEEFPGVVGFFRSLETKKYKVQVRVFLSRYRGYQTCPTCQGGRLREEARAVLVGERNIEQLSALSVTRWACSSRRGSRRSATRRWWSACARSSCGG